MLSIHHVIAFSILFSIVLGESNESDEDEQPFDHVSVRGNKNAKKDAAKLAEQQISVIGKLRCAEDADSNIKAKIVLKISRNGAEIMSARYPSINKQGSTLISMKRTEPKFLFLEIIPDSSDGSKCGKTIKGKVRMREFKSSNNNSKNKIFDIGECDFALGECSKFEKRNGPQNLTIVGDIRCANSKNVRATVIIQSKRRDARVIKSQVFDSKVRTSSLLETEAKEPNTVFLRIVPDPSMGPNCQKTIEAKLGVREFKPRNGKGVFDVGRCDLSTGKCTKFPFPQNK